jgi:hypothetical protein
MAVFPGAFTTKLASAGNYLFLHLNLLVSYSLEVLTFSFSSSFTPSENIYGTSLFVQH